MAEAKYILTIGKIGGMLSMEDYVFIKKNILGNFLESEFKANKANMRLVKEDESFKAILVTVECDVECIRNLCENEKGLFEKGFAVSYKKTK